MSSDNAPWVFALDGVECRICGSSIKLQYAAEDRNGPGAWRGYAQELKLASQRRGPQPLVPAELCYSSFQGETRTMHAACWKVAESMWKNEFTMDELNGFLDISADLASFLPEIVHQVSPIEIDAALTSGISEVVTHESNTAISASDELLNTMEIEGLEKPMLPDMKNHSLPSELDRHISRWMSTIESEDVETLQNPTLQYWSSVTRMLETHPQFSDIPRSQAAEKIAQILPNLHAGGLDSFPHLANYDIVYANAMSILLTLHRLPLENIPNAPDLNGNRARLTQPRSIKIPPALDTPAKFRLKFSTLRRFGATEANDDRKNLRVGDKYLRDIWFGPPDTEIQTDADDVLLEIPSFAGLRFIRDHVGVFEVLVKQGDMWRSCWQQDPSFKWHESMSGVQSTVVEWEAGVGQPYFSIIANVSAILFFFPVLRDLLTDISRRIGI